MKRTAKISNHYIYDRRRRERFINKHINGDGNVIDEFIINKEHKDGSEIHKITDTGMIIIYNHDTGKLITKLIARPNQITRYYKDINRNPPSWLLTLAQWHKDLNYNKVR